MVLSDVRRPLITSLGQGGMTERGAMALFAPLSSALPLDAPAISLDAPILTVELPENATEAAILADGVVVTVIGG